jgi:thiol-disulfide isomerase/thioredoxin
MIFVRQFLRRRSRFLTIILAMTGIGIMIAYEYCPGSCSYLKGTVLHVDLKYLGILYMAMIIILALLRRTLLGTMLLAFGMGGEIFLTSYQVRSGVYCPYCLAFAATVALAFLVNFERSRRGLIALAAGAGLVFFLLFFSGSTTPLYAADIPTTTFGNGPVEVRVYTDYFCGPCQAEESELMQLVTELVEKNLIRVTFVDTPIHKETVLYAAYFLAAINTKGTFGQATAARADLFEAAGLKITEKADLEKFLKKKGLEIRSFDAAPAFKILSNYLAEDKIDSTPTVVIVHPKGKETLGRRELILAALRKLKK